MQLIKGFGLVVLAVVAIALGAALLALSPKVATAAVSVDYSKMTIRQLKAIAKGTGIKSWERLRKADLIMALSAI